MKKATVLIATRKGIKTESAYIDDNGVVFYSRDPFGNWSISDLATGCLLNSGYSTRKNAAADFESYLKDKMADMMKNKPEKYIKAARLIAGSVIDLQLKGDPEGIANHYTRKALMTAYDGVYSFYLEPFDHSADIKGQYMEAWPQDECGSSLNNGITDKDIYRSLVSGDDFYRLIGVSDLLVRCRIFKIAAYTLGRPYGHLYDLWINADTIRANRERTNQRAEQEEARKRMDQKRAEKQEQRKKDENMKKESTTKNWFEYCGTLEELKKTYRRLAMQYHPDRGGDNETMAAINNAYEKTFEDLKTRNNRKANANQQGYRYTNETAADYINIIAQLLKFDGLIVELCGYWIWVSGNTYAAKETLKATGFRWSTSKKKWYFDTLTGNKEKKHFCGRTSMAQIRMKYGSVTFEGDSTADDGSRLAYNG